MVRSTKKIKSADVTRREIETAGLFTVPLGLSFGNYRSFDEEDSPFEVMKTTGYYDALIPAWYLEKHQARGTTTSHLDCPHCTSTCYGYGKLHPQ